MSGASFFLIGIVSLTFSAMCTYAAFFGRDGSWQDLALVTAFGLFWGIIGWPFMFAAVIRRSPSRTSDEVPVERPWLTDRDWASGRIREAKSPSASALMQAVLTLYLLGVTMPVISRLPEIIRTANSSWKWTTLAFPMIDVGMVLILLYLLVRVPKFGTSTFESTSLPGVVGGKLLGTVLIPRILQPASGYRVKLSCIAEYACNRSTRSYVAWQDERIVTPAIRCAEKRETAVPVVFSIPSDCPESSRSRDDPVEWRLEVSARLPGVDYSTQFVVPVFKRRQVQANIQLDESLAADADTHRDATLLLLEAGIRKEPLPGGGVRLVFGAGRHWGLALFLTFVFAICLGLIMLMYHLEAPIVWPIGFAALSVLSAYGVVHFWFYRSVVEASRNGLALWRGVFGIGRKYFFSVDQIDDFGTDQIESPDTAALKSLFVILHNDQDFELAKGITSMVIERAMFKELDVALGRSSE